MKKDEVRIGCTYSAKVSGSVVPVRITQEKWKGDKHTGWVGTNTQTGRSVYVKSAQRLRGLVEEGEPAPAARAARLAPVANNGGDVAPVAAAAEPVGVSAVAASPVPPKAAKTGKAAKGKKPAPAPKTGTGPKAGKGAKAPKERKPKADRPMSGLDAAAKVLADAGEPMHVKDIVATAEKQGLWKSKAGKTPEATVYAAIIREIFSKGVDSRFVKKDRGLFAAAGK